MTKYEELHQQLKTSQFTWPVAGKKTQGISYIYLIFI